MDDFYAYFYYYETRLFDEISLMIGEMVNYEWLIVILMMDCSFKIC